MEVVTVPGGASSKSSCATAEAVRDCRESVLSEGRMSLEESCVRRGFFAGVWSISGFPSLVGGVVGGGRGAEAQAGAA
jgi:hypothetical protein